MFRLAAYLIAWRWYKVIRIQVDVGGLSVSLEGTCPHGPNSFSKGSF